MKQENYSPKVDEEHLQYIRPAVSPKKRVIVAAACVLDCGFMAVSARHWDKAMHEQVSYLPEDKRKCSISNQGFIDQYGQYVDRETARRIAIENGQPLIGENWGNLLYSENLY